MANPDDEAVPRYRRALLVYTVAIGGPTLILLALGLHSVQRQQHAIDQLRMANLRLSAGQLAASLTERIEALASAALHDPEITAAMTMDAQAGDAAGPSIPRSVLDRIAARHPIAAELFLIENRHVTSPALHVRSGLALELERAATRDGVAGLLLRAEELEFAEARPDLAVSAYRTAAARAVSATVRAGALARLARANRRAGRADAAVAVYRQLVEQFADHTDRFARPYGIVAALELHDLGSSSDAGPLLQVRDDILQGRWNLTPDQFTYFLNELDARVHADEAPAARQRIARQFERARIVEQQLPFRTPTDDASRPASEVFTHDGERHHVFHRQLTADAGAMQLALWVNVPWVAEALLPDTQRALGIEGEARIVPAGDALAAPATLDAAWAPLGGVFSASSLLLHAPPEMARTLLSPAALFAGTTLFVLALLVMGVLLIVRDLSREKALNRLRTDFVSAASHELRTPLTMIRLYAQTLLEDVDADREERRGSYEIIAEETERLKHLLDKVLDFSRIDRGRRSYRRERASVQEVVAGALRLYEPQLRRRGFALEAQLTCDACDSLIDSEAVTGAVLNLLDNAVKYSAAVRRIHVRLDRSEDHVVVAVEDEGVGIDPRDQSRIFEQFYRCAHSSERGGYGLGLFLVQHVMDAHGGRVEVTSQPGRGSCFRLLFPLAAGHAEPADTARDAGERG